MESKGILRPVDDTDGRFYIRPPPPERKGFTQITPDEVIAAIPTYRVWKRSPFVESAYYCELCHQQYKEGDYVKCLPCKHRFHTYCLENWLKWVRARCPVDRLYVYDVEPSEHSDYICEDGEEESVNDIPSFEEDQVIASASGALDSSKKAAVKDEQVARTSSEIALAILQQFGFSNRLCKTANRKAYLKGKSEERAEEKPKAANQNRKDVKIKLKEQNSSNHSFGRTEKSEGDGSGAQEKMSRLLKLSKPRKTQAISGYKLKPLNIPTPTKMDHRSAETVKTSNQFFTRSFRPGKSSGVEIANSRNVANISMYETHFVSGKKSPHVSFGKEDLKSTPATPKSKVIHAPPKNPPIDHETNRSIYGHYLHSSSGKQKDKPGLVPHNSDKNKCLNSKSPMQNKKPVILNTPKSDFELYLRSQKRIPVGQKNSLKKNDKIYHESLNSGFRQEPKVAISNINTSKDKIYNNELCRIKKTLSDRPVVDGRGKLKELGEDKIVAKNDPFKKSPPKAGPYYEGHGISFGKTRSNLVKPNYDNTKSYGLSNILRQTPSRESSISIKKVFGFDKNPRLPPIELLPSKTVVRFKTPLGSENISKVERSLRRAKTSSLIRTALH